MNDRPHLLPRTLAFALGLGLLASCADPFHTPIPPQAGAGGAPSGGTGGSVTPPSGGSGGSVTPPPGGSGGSVTPPPGGSGGSPPAGGSGGTPPNPDAAAPPPPVDAAPAPPVKLDAPVLPATKRCVPLPDQEEFDCPLMGAAQIRNWLPVTPPIGKDDLCFPQPHPADECPFYRPTFRQYMIATQPVDAAGKPAFLTWNTLENTFGAGRNTPTPAVPVLLGGITQAGGRRVLIDINGNPVYYGIHMNKVMVDFIKENRLDLGAEAVKNADPNLEIPEGAVTTKEAWMVVVGNQPNNFITTRARVPTFRVMRVGGSAEIIEDVNTLRDVNLQLIGIHIVHALPGHPEMVWGTFQHKVLATGEFDIAPTTDNKNENDATAAVVEVPGVNYVLFPRGTAKNLANIGRATDQLMFNEATQTFAGQTTPVYRVYPASKSHTADEDEAITKLNLSVSTIFADAQRLGQLPANDRRGHYRFVGATWHDVPALTFAINVPLVNDETLGDIKTFGSDDPLSFTAGEDRLSGMALESFTQGVGSFPSCFACHDTRSATSSGVPSEKDLANPPLMGPKKINVSHIFNEVVRLDLK
jgi:hypothetical protein